MKNRLKKALALILCAALSAAILPAFPLVSDTVSSESASSSASSTQLDPTDEANLSDLNASYEELQKKLDQLKDEETQLKSDAKDAKQVLNNLNSQISAAQKQLDILDEKIADLDDELAKLGDNKTQLEAEIAANLEIFKQRVRAIYMNGTTNELELLLSSDNYLDLLTRAEVLRRISEHDKTLITSLLADKSDLEATITDTETLRAEAAVAKADQKAKRKELNSKYDESETLLKSINSDQAETAAAIKKYQQEMEEAQKEIAEILAKYASDGDYVGGDLAWPLPGFTKITSPYGNRSSGFHTGTDIAGRNSEGELCYGYNVIAANTGTVIAVRDLGSKSYGKYIIIDHGGGCRTLYAHLSKVLVKEGQTVMRGDVIAHAGSTGNSTGPHLHFELWINDKRVDPMDYLTVPKG